MSIQYQFSMDDFADCYAAKICSELTVKEMKNPNEKVNAIVRKTMEDCAAQMVSK
jgi:hypothetical protein